MSVNLPTCPTDCSSVLPVLDFEHCNPEIHRGEIRHIYVMAYDGLQLANWESLAVWTARLSNAGVDEDEIRTLTVSADLPVPDQTEDIISDNRRVYGLKTFVINCDIDDVSDANYEFMRTMECGITVRIWYATEDLLFGGPEGIEAFFKLGYAIERGFNGIHKIQGTVTWESQFSPERTTNPMA